MKYFKTLPLITQQDFNGNTITVNNLISRCYFLPTLLKNLLLFYQYDVQEGDTPDTLAYKYYFNDSYRYWLILYSNNVLDPQEFWPLTTSQFNNYIISNYQESAGTGNDAIAYAMSTIHHYEKTITTLNSSNLSSQVLTYNIGEDEYINSVQSQIQTASYYDEGGNLVTITKTTTIQSVSIYDYEQKLNESKRSIYILNSNYVNSAESQFNNLMS